MEGSRLYVGNLKYSATGQELEMLFAAYGQVKEVSIIEGRGFGFVEMSNANEAEKAKDALDGRDFLGRTMRIDIARPPRGGNRPRREFTGDRQ